MFHCYFSENNIVLRLSCVVAQVCTDYIYTYTHRAPCMCQTQCQTLKTHDPCPHGAGGTAQATCPARCCIRPSWWSLDPTEVHSHSHHPTGLSSGGAPVSLPTITLPIVPLFPVPVPTLSPFSTLLPKCKSDDGLILY